MSDGLDQLDLLTWEPRSSRHTDPMTSKLAAHRSASSRRHDWLIVLLNLSVADMTDFELAAATGKAQTSIGKRRGECRDEGWVEASVANGKNITRPAPSGSAAIVWRITASGREELLKRQEKRAA